MIRGLDGLGARIRAVRQAAGLSQVELSRRVGLSRIAMNELELGTTRDPHASRIVALARVLQVTTDFLLGCDVTPPSHEKAPSHYA